MMISVGQLRMSKYKISERVLIRYNLDTSTHKPKRHLNMAIVIVKIFNQIILTLKITKPRQ